MYSQSKSPAFNSRSLYFSQIFVRTVRLTRTDCYSFHTAHCSLRIDASLTLLCIIDLNRLNVFSALFNQDTHFRKLLCQYFSRFVVGSLWIDILSDDTVVAIRLINHLAKTENRQVILDSTNLNGGFIQSHSLLLKQLFRSNSRSSTLFSPLFFLVSSQRKRNRINSRKIEFNEMEK